MAKVLTQQEKDKLEELHKEKDEIYIKMKHLWGQQRKDMYKKYIVILNKIKTIKPS